MKLLERFKGIKNIKNIKSKINIKNLRKKKSEKSPMEKDYQKNLAKLGRELTVRLLSGILGTTVLLIFIFSTVSLRYMGRTLDENTKARLERSREQRKMEIKDYYLNLEREMKKDIGKGITSLKGNEEYYEENYKALGIDEIALFNGEYKVLYQSSTRDLLPIKKEIKAIKFQNPLYIDQMKIDNDESYQHIYYKVFKENGREEYLYYKLNNTHLNKILLKSPYQADILNDEFYITASNRELESREYVIDEINKKMLDGRVGEEIYQGKLYSYTYIDLDGESVYLKVYEDLDVYRAPLMRYKKKIQLLWVISLMLSLVVIFFIRISIESYAKGVSKADIEKEGDKKYKFLKEDILGVFDELDEMKGSLNKLNVLMDNLSEIKEKVISQNTYIIQKKKEDEEIIKKVIKDSELKKKLKGKL